MCKLLLGVEPHQFGSGRQSVHSLPTVTLQLCTFRPVLEQELPHHYLSTSAYKERMVYADVVQPFHVTRINGVKLCICGHPQRPVRSMAHRPAIWPQYTLTSIKWHVFVYANTVIVMVAVFNRPVLSSDGSLSVSPILCLTSLVGDILMNTRLLNLICHSHDGDDEFAPSLSLKGSRA